ncbi:Electron transport complex protein RnfB [Candidatus Palibaumannia cicadellinicola]|uniref:Electron transport complex protein RnfB n=1 Tax=Candidatus Palibaumannia cicadellinicola TaxID=186490 RepID=A0A0K2BKW4_9GAMM|nr:Electron transport complex protein RnfB [Candidatus Baumannia cicadellinicola]
MNVKLPIIDNKEVAWINEADCIGCTKCIKVCPVKAIIGTHRTVHTVVSDLCTGCTMCIHPCPTDCVVMRKRLD